MRLRPIGESEDIDVLAEALAPGFGGETEAARDLLAQTFRLLTADPRPDPWGSPRRGKGRSRSPA